MPHAFNATDLSIESYLGSVAWYRKDFVAPPANGSGVTWVLRFESVNHRARVFLNGREIGSRAAPYIPFEVPARALLPGQPNRLVLRVDSRRSRMDVPPGGLSAVGLPRGGWWNYGGILREVYLRRVHRVDIADVFAQPRLRCRGCAAEILVGATLRNPGPRKVKVRLRGSVGGQRLRFDEVVVPRRSSRRVGARTRIRRPRLWEPGRPNLYRVRLAAIRRKKRVASYVTHMGVRSLRVTRSGRLVLNGRRLRLRGASMHEDHPTRGAALTPAEIDHNFALLRELGATVTRAHYPLHPRTLELADRAGIMVWAQVPFWRMPSASIASGFVRARGVRYLRDTILRDRNHPSIFAWSVANELPSIVSPSQRRYIGDAARTIRRLDPSRLAAIDISGWPPVPPEEQGYSHLDALGVNSYYGWYRGPNGHTADRRLLGPFLDQMHRYYPRHALLVTEFGAEANRAGPDWEKGTFGFQAQLLRHHLQTYDSRPFLNGAILWILRDFRVRPGWHGGNPEPTPPLNAKGLVTEAGERKPAFGEVARLFRSVRALR